MALFFLLGQIPDGTWHHRVVRAPSETQVISFWNELWEGQPVLCLSHRDLFDALAVTQKTGQLEGDTGVFFGVCQTEQNTNDQNDQQRNKSPDDGMISIVPLLAKSAQINDALDDYQANNPDKKILSVLSVDPLVEVLSFMDDVEKGLIKPDETLL